MDFPKKNNFESEEEFCRRVELFYDAQDEKAERAIERYYERRYAE